MQIGYITKERLNRAVILPQKDFLRAGDYAIKKGRVELVEMIFDYVAFMVWISFGIKYLDLLNIENLELKSTLIILIFLLINYLISLPFSIYYKFKLDKEFGFSTITPKLFIIDSIKSLLLSALVGGIIIYGVVSIISNFSNWWFFAFIFVFSIIIFINAIFPTFIVPLFNKLTTLENSELKTKIENLLSSVGFGSSGVFVIDSSKRDMRLNAYFAGFGKTKKVVLYDTLIEKLTNSELVAVLGHEIGHFKHKDMFKNIAIMGVLFFIMFFIFGNIPNQLFEELNITNSPHVVIILFLIFSSLISFLFLPLFSLISRSNEYEADKFGAEIGGRENLISALKKLVNENKSFPKSHKLYIFFYYTHPPLIERLKALGEKID